MSKKIGRYEIREFLGEGGAGTVYKAWDPAVQREVAIKLLTAKSSDQRARFQREARLLAQMTHPHVVTVYDFGEHEDVPYIVMRYMDGGSMRDLLERERLSNEEIVRIMTKVAGGLDEAHALGIVHRDIKPENILFDHRQEPYLADFGLSKIFSDSNQNNPTVDEIMGTITYMSPEQVRGQKLDHLTDIYSLGIMFFEACNGYLPFDADEPVAIAFKQAYEEPPSMDHLSQPIADVIRKALEKKPEDRYPSAGALVSAFESALKPVAQGSSGNRITSDQAAAGPAQGSRAWMGVAGVGMVALLGLGSFFFIGNPFGGGSDGPVAPTVDSFPAVSSSISESGEASPVPATPTEAAEQAVLPTSTLIDFGPTSTPIIDEVTGTLLPEPEPLFLVGETGVELLSGPDSEGFEVVLSLNMGESLDVIARASNPDWLLVEHTNGMAGWINQEVGELQGIVLADIEIASTEPAPVPTETPTETASPTETLPPTETPTPSETPTATPTATFTPTLTPVATNTSAAPTAVPTPIATPCRPTDPDCDDVDQDPDRGLYDLCPDLKGNPGTCGCPVDHPNNCAVGGGGDDDGGEEAPP